MPEERLRRERELVEIYMRTGEADGPLAFLKLEPKHVVIIDYTNWRGERAERKVIPGRFVYEATEWHPEEQWILYAFDVERNNERGFALLNIHSIKKP